MSLLGKKIQILWFLSNPKDGCIATSEAFGLVGYAKKLEGLPETKQSDKIQQLAQTLHKYAVDIDLKFIIDSKCPVSEL